MTLPAEQVLDRLAAEERCFAGLFLTYGFDPSFFEEHVLRAVLRLSSDPTEQPARYHDEAIRALQTTPVAVVADAGVRQGGRRLPYDVLDVSERVFHPKLVLLVYDEYARVHVGSGNLTAGGYGLNAELFVTMDLRYADSAEARMLHDLLLCVERAAGTARRGGTQYRLVLEELRRRLPAPLAAPDVDATWLDSTLPTSILDQVVALLPAKAEIQRVGIMAPFFERDDRAAAESMASVFGRLSDLAGPTAHLDVGVLWENPSVRPKAHELGIEDGLNVLWAWRDPEDGAIEYLVPTKVARTYLHYLDQQGVFQTWRLVDVHKALDAGALWPVAEPVAYAPPAALESAASAFGSMQRWLHPATRIQDGRPLHRPLHAKILTIAYETDDGPESLVVVGSANASRRALLLPTHAGGNVELCLAFRVRGAASLPDIAPELVAAPQTGLDVRERDFPELGVNYANAVDGVTYDAGARTLVVDWSGESGIDLPPWSLIYRDAVISVGQTKPAHPTVVNEFDLHRSSAEVSLVVGDAAYPIPILVADLVALPVGPSEDLLSLQELLLMLGRRTGTERLKLLAEQRASASAEPEGALDEVFGTGFVPTDVFRAWWNVAKELGDSQTSVAAFRLRLEGALGLAAVWQRLLGSVRKDPGLRADTVWFYGAELLRELEVVSLTDDAAGDKKREYLTNFLRRLRTDLQAVMSLEDSPPWLDQVFAFYGVSQ